MIVRTYIALLTAMLLALTVQSETIRGTILGEDRSGREFENLKGSLGNQIGERHLKKKKKDKSSRVIVNYKTDRGKKLALDLASNVYYDFSNDNTVVVELNAQSKKSLKDLHADVHAVDEDTPMAAQYIFEGYYDGNSSSRRLTQTTPYGVTMVQADQLLVRPKVSKRPTVCLVDTGVLYTHPDLPQSLMTGSNRFSTTFNTELYWQLGVDGHGTCLAGIISANMTNNIGVRGVGNIPLYITRGMNDQGMCMQSDILDALSECQAQGAKVISLSFGGGGISTTFQQVLDNLYDNLGVLIFASSGNDGTASVMYPAAYDKVVAVGAVNETGEHWHASNWGPSLELMAPGDRVWCTGINNGQATYSLYSGTSMAAPYAAGVAALVWSHFPHCTNSQIRYALAYTAKDINTPGCDQLTGNGIVQAKAAYDFLKSNPCRTASWGRSLPTDGCSVV